MVEREGMRRGGCSWGGGVLGRWSLRRLLLDSPLVGRRLAHSVLEQGERPVKLTTETAQARPTVQYIAEDEEGEVLDCPLCLSTLSATGMVRLAWCAHRCCEPCLRQYLAIEIFEARVPVNCPVCHESMHPSDVRRIVDNPTLYDKYEEFSVRRALAADPDTRWCPAPDCSFAVVATGCASCPKLTCLAPGCGASFCYHCKAAWHPTQTCDAARRSRQPPPRAPQPSHSEMEHGERSLDHLRRKHQADLPGARLRRVVLLPLQGGVAPHADVRRRAPQPPAAAARAAALAQRNGARRGEAVPALLGAHREGGGRLVQPHGVLRVRRRVLLALHEGGLRSALPQSERLHVLGQETVVEKKEASLAARYAGGCAARHRRGGGSGAARAAGGAAAVGRQARAQETAPRQAGEAQGCSGRCGRCCANSIAAGGGAGGGHRRADPAVLRVRRGAGVAVPRGGLRRRARALRRRPRPARGHRARPRRRLAPPGAQHR